MSIIMTDMNKQIAKIRRLEFYFVSKSDALVELTLPSDSNIYASKYELYLPDKKVLQEKLKQWTLEEGGVSE